MSINYGFSLKGTSHEKFGKPCQDYNLIKQKDDYTILIACDGVGSAKNSDIGSKTAAEAALNFCIENFPLNATPQALENMILMSFNAAFREIAFIANDAKEDLAEYCTTLHLVVYHESSGLISYGHVGDGSIIGLNTYSGKYELIKEPMKDKDGESVIPLQFGANYWDVGSSSESYAAIVISTDGISDNLFAPKILKNYDEKLNVHELRKFLDKNYGELSLDNVAEFNEFLIDLFGCNNYKDITSDDKTMVVAISETLDAVTLDDEYYKPIDFKKIYTEAYNRLYNNTSEKTIHSTPKNNTTSTMQQDTKVDNSISIQKDSNLDGLISTKPDDDIKKLPSIQLEPDLDELISTKPNDDINELPFIQLEPNLDELTSIPQDSVIENSGAEEKSSDSSDDLKLLSQNLKSGKTTDQSPSHKNNIKTAKTKTKTTTTKAKTTTTRRSSYKAKHHKKQHFIEDFIDILIEGLQSLKK